MGDSIYEAYLEKGELWVENLESRNKEKIGNAKRYAISSDEAGYIHVVWWDGKMIRYWNNVPGFWALLGELGREGVNVDVLKKEARSWNWNALENDSWAMMSKLTGEQRAMMKYIWMYAKFEVEDPWIGDQSTYSIKVCKYKKFNRKIPGGITKLSIGHTQGSEEGSSSVTYGYKRDDVLYTFEAYNIKYSNDKIPRNIRIKLKLTKEEGTGDVYMYINGMELNMLSYGTSWISIPVNYLKSSGDNAVLFAANYDNSASGEGWIKVSTVFKADVQILDVLIGGDSLYDDPDHDNLTTAEERRIGTDPLNPDTDGDGMPDGWEYTHKLNPLSASDKYADPDGDGLSNYEEYLHGTKPHVWDTDGDGMPDGWEVKYGTDPTKYDASVDGDDDGLTNIQEYRNGTNPNMYDTDGDGLSDGQEVKGWTAWYYKKSSDSSSSNSNGGSGAGGGDGSPDHRIHVMISPGASLSLGSNDVGNGGLTKVSYKVTSNPLVADTDGDGLSDYQEYKRGLDPRKVDTDGDGLDDGNEYYTKVYEYPTRYYNKGGTVKLNLSWEEEKCAVGVKSVEFIVGIRANGGTFSATMYYGNTKMKTISTSDVKYDSVDLTKYAGKTTRYVHVVLSGKGWIETYKVVLEEESDPHNWDTDGDGLSDGYEVNGKGGYVTSPVNPDTDGDGISDKMEENGWSWNYKTDTKYMNKNGFHTNPLENDTDGDGVVDSKDANPLGNIVIKIEVVKYHWKGITVFAGFKLDGGNKKIQYYTVRKDTDLGQQIFYYDVSDKIGATVKVDWAAFYTKPWQQLGGDALLWSGKITKIANNLNYTVYNDKNGKNFTFRLQSIVLHRVHTIGVYSESEFKDGHYLYKGKYYVLYVTSSSASGNIVKGKNIILVPDAIFVNSELYKDINAGQITYLRGSDGKVAKMGAMTTKSMGVHIVGMFFLKSTAKQIQQLLGLLEKNTKGKSFASYAVITPDMANLPGDVLSAIPVENIQNSKTGTAPTDSWGDILGAIKVTGVSVVGFLANEVVAVGNFIVHAPGIIQHYALALWSTAVNTVKTAVNDVKTAVDAFVDWVKREVSGIFEGLKKKIDEMEKQAAEIYRGFIEAVYNKNTIAEAISAAKMLVLVGAAAVLITGLTFALGMAINANPIVGAIIAGVAIAAFMAVFYGLYPKQCLEAGEKLKSAGDIMLMPADELYDTDKKYGGAPGWVLTAISATIGSSWSGVASNEAGAVGLSLGLTVVSLFATLPLLGTWYKDTATKKKIGVGLLGIATFSLIGTMKGGLGWVKNSKSMGGFIVRMVFYSMFLLIGAYSVATLIGYLHSG